jgi:hypothetical protein
VRAPGLLVPCLTTFTSSAAGFSEYRAEHPPDFHRHPQRGSRLYGRLVGSRDFSHCEQRPRPDRRTCRRMVWKEKNSWAQPKLRAHCGAAVRRLCGALRVHALAGDHRKRATMLPSLLGEFAGQRQ